MPSHLSRGGSVILAALLLATPTELAARHYGPGGYAYPRAYAGRYVGRYVYPGYPAYYGARVYPRYYGYGGYPGYYRYGGYYGYHGYYHHHHGDDAWIAVGAGALGILLGTLIAQPRAYAYPYHPYVHQPYVQQPYVYQNHAPQAQQCPDGSTVPAGTYCPELRVPRG